MTTPSVAPFRTLAGEFPAGERVLACLASHVVGEPVRVVFNARVTVPVTVQAATGTVVVDPTRTSLADVLVAAALVRRRSGIREACGDGDVLPATLAAVWAAAAGRQLGRRLPRLAARMAEWRSWCRDGDPDRAPQVVWETVPLEPLTAAGPASSISWSPGLSFAGTGGDWPVVLAAITSGGIPARNIPGFPLPIVTVPFNFDCPTATGADVEQYETMCRDMMNVQREWVQCYHRTSQDDRWNSHNLRRYRQGKHLDESRLAQAVVQAREGGPARVFHRRRSASEHVFDPSEHLLAVGIDLNPAAGSTTIDDAAYRHALGERHLRLDMIAVMLNMFRMLGVRVSITGFFDRVIDVAGRPHYLHLPMNIKEPDEPWHGACHARLATLLIGRGVRVPGTPAMLLPATLETVGQRIEAALAGVPPRHLRLFGMFGSGLPRSVSRLRPEAVNSHVVAAAEAVLGRWHRDWAEMRFSSDSTYVPPEIKAAAAPGTRLHRLLTV